MHAVIRADCQKVLWEAIAKRNVCSRENCSFFEILLKKKSFPEVHHLSSQ